MEDRATKPALRGHCSITIHFTSFYQRQDKRKVQKNEEQNNCTLLPLEARGLSLPLSVEVVSCPTRLSSRGIQHSDVLLLKVTLIIRIIHTQKKGRAVGKKKDMVKGG